MLRTRQILDNSTFRQSASDTLRFSGTTIIDELQLGTGSWLDEKSFTYVQDFFTQKYTWASFFWMASNNVHPRSENLINIYPLSDDGVGSGSTLYVFGIDGDDNSEFYKLNLDDYSFTSEATRFSRDTNNYTGDLIPEIIIGTTYVKEENTIYYVFRYKDVSSVGLGKFDFNNHINTVYNNTSGNYTGDLFENTFSVREFITHYIETGSTYLHFILGGKIYRFNATSQTNKIYSSTSGNYSGTLLSTSGVWAEQIDRNLYVCLGGSSASSAGLWKLDLNTNTAIKFTTVSNNYNGDKITNNSFFKVAKDSSNNIWCSTRNAIWKYNPATNTGTNYSSTSGNFSGDSLGSIDDFIMTLDDKMIYTSSQSALVIFDTVNLTASRYTKATDRTAGKIAHYARDWEANYPYLYMVLYSGYGDYIAADRNISEGEIGNGFIRLSLSDRTYKQFINFGHTVNAKNLGGSVSSLNIFNQDFVNKSFIDNYYIFSNDFTVKTLLGNKYIDLSDTLLDAITGNTGGGGTLDFTATNGLTKSGNNVQLGGSISANTSISVGSNTFIISGSATQANFGSSAITLKSKINGFDQFYINIDETGGNIFDINGRGLRYNDNYSNTFTKHSLVDKHFVTGITSQLTVSGGSSYVDANKNIKIGDNNLTSVTASTKNITLGYDNLTASTRTTVESNITIGYNLGNVDYEYFNSIDIGFDVAKNGKSLNGDQYTNGNHIAIGYRTMSNITGTTSSSGMIAIGQDAMSNAIARNGGGTIAIGSSFASADFELGNIGIGGAGTNAIIGRHNILIGDLAGANMSGGTPGAHGVGSTQANIAIGIHTLEYGAGNKGTFVGCEAGSGRIRGQANSGFGNWSLPRSFGDYNNGLGSFAGYHASTILTGSTNTFIGWRSSYSTAALSNTIVLAHNYEAALSNRVYLGSTAQKVILTATPTSDSTSDQVLVRKTTNGEIETRTVESIIGGISGTVTDAEKSSIRKMQYLFNPLTHPNVLEAYEADDITLDGVDTDAILQLIDKVGQVNYFASTDAAGSATLVDDVIDFGPTSAARYTHSNPADFDKFKTSSGEIIALMYLGADDDDTNLLILDANAIGTTSFTFKLDGLGRPRITYNDGTTTHTIYANVTIREGYHVVSWASDGTQWKIFIDGIECRTSLSGAASVNSGHWLGSHTNPNDITRIRLTGTDLKLKALYFFNDILADKDRLNYVREFKNKFDLDEFIGLSLVTYGDSITATAHWQKYVCQRLGMVDVNRGIGGTYVQENGMTAYVDAEGNRIDGEPTGTEGVDYFQILSSMSNQERVDTIPLDSDIILVFGGANDGGIGSSTIADTGVTTFYGAYKTMLDRIYTRCPNALIALITPPHHATADANLVPGTGYDSVRKAIREIGYLYSYPVIDLKASAQINKNNYATYLSDQVHPNDAGGKKMAAVIAHELGILKPFN